jgi:hypothetical protein
MWIAFILLSITAAVLPAPAPVPQRFRAGLEQVSAWREKAADLHPAFAKTYPVALAVDGHWQVFEADAAGGNWRLAAQAPTQFNVPIGIRAAMPLDFFDNRMACVVSPEVFDTPDGYAFILHEFVHCYQWESVEMKLKQGLAVYREAMEGKNYMWELEHPFPYGNAEVRRLYDLWQAELQKGRTLEAGRWRSVLKQRLNGHDWEYMTWQEWKEGLARLLENRVRARFGVKGNLPAADPQFNRVSFYRGGELFITRLAEGEPGLDRNIELLYRRIFASGG